MNNFMTFYTMYFPIIKFGLIEVHFVHPNSHLSFNLHYQTIIFYPRHYRDRTRIESNLILEHYERIKRTIITFDLAV